MSDYSIGSSSVSSIGAAIRNKGMETNLLYPQEMPNAIRNLKNILQYPSPPFAQVNNIEPFGYYNAEYYRDSMVGSKSNTLLTTGFGGINIWYCSNYETREGWFYKEGGEGPIYTRSIVNGEQIYNPDILKNIQSHNINFYYMKYLKTSTFVSGSSYSVLNNININPEIFKGFLNASMLPDFFKYYNLYNNCKITHFIGGGTARLESKDIVIPNNTAWCGNYVKYMPFAYMSCYATNLKHGVIGPNVITCDAAYYSSNLETLDIYSNKIETMFYLAHDCPNLNIINGHGLYLSSVYNACYCFSWSSGSPMSFNNLKIGCELDKNFLQYRPHYRVTEYNEPFVSYCMYGSNFNNFPNFGNYKNIGFLNIYLRSSYSSSFINNAIFNLDTISNTNDMDIFISGVSGIQINCIEAKHGGVVIYSYDSPAGSEQIDYLNNIHIEDVGPYSSSAGNTHFTISGFQSFKNIEFDVPNISIRVNNHSIHLDNWFYSPLINFNNFNFYCEYIIDSSKGYGGFYFYPTGCPNIEGNFHFNAHFVNCSPLYAQNIGAPAGGGRSVCKDRNKIINMFITKEYVNLLYNNGKYYDAVFSPLYDGEEYLIWSNDGDNFYNTKYNIYVYPIY